MTAAAKTRNKAAPLADWRKGKSPAQQIRESLERSRVLGKTFDAAWQFALSRVLWPHETESRHMWWAILAGQIEVWREAYERQVTTARSIAALRGVIPA